jgi:mycothiol system anti-sigma-R factor
MTDKISCEDVVAELFHYLDREVDQATTEKINHHLKNCRECFSRAEFEKLLRRRVADAGEAEVPDEVQKRIIELMKRF